MDEELKQYLDAKFAGVDARLNGLDAKFIEVDRKVSGLDAKFIEVDRKVSGLDAKFIEVDRRFTGLRDELAEEMRHMQTKLLRGFEAFSASQAIRVQKLEADQSNLNAAMGGRMDAVESRLLQIELRLGLIGPQGRG